MKLAALVAQLAFAQWLIEQESAQKYLLLGASLLSHPERITALITETQPEAGIVVASSAGLVAKGGTYEDIPAGSIAIHYITGPLIKADSWSSFGMASMGSRIMLADSHPNIKAHVAVWNSPGGTVDGTEDFSRAIAGTKKPFVSFVDGLLASAAVWASSGSNEIWAAGRTTRIGSVGTMLSFLDTSGMLAKLGIKEIRSRADDSKDKNESFYQLLEGNEGPIKVEMLNPLNNIFLSDYQENRNGKLKLEKASEKGAAPEPLTGKMYLAEEAMNRFGMIDNIGTLEQAIARAAEIADTPSLNTKNTLKPNNMFGNKHPKLTALKGLGADQITQEHIDEVNAELLANGVTGVILVLSSFTADAQTLESNVVSLSAKVAGLEKDKAKADSDLVVANQAIASLETEKTELGAKVVKLETSRAIGSTPPIKQGQENLPPIEGAATQALDDQHAEHNLEAYHALGLQPPAKK